MDGLTASPRHRLFTLSFAALGVVYGDIGTSPLYALRQSLLHLSLNKVNLFGILSLIFWSLIIVISCKYLLIILRADNDGEGGIMALSTLLNQSLEKLAPWLLFFTILGVGLIFGDGLLTPAISVLSAVEGIQSLSPAFATFVVPITLIILIGLFWLQKAGSEKIGIVFGPIILLWFITIGLLGLVQIIKQPQILKALNPYCAYQFFIQQKQTAFIALGGVFLVVTGGEALYADVGHFGKNAIRLAWFTIVLPGLLLNYFGQGAYLLTHPQAISNPFYNLAPHWFLPILIGLATIATIIASQAIIAAVFSIIKQASLLNLVPRFKIIQTSPSVRGQVYLPTVNFLLAVGTCSLVLTFRSSTHLANAYGIAVNLYMLLTTVLVTQVAARTWHWNFFQLLIFPVFFALDLAYLSGNLHKISAGGWIPLSIALLTMVIMYTWYQGFIQLRRLNFKEERADQYIINELNKKKIRRLPGTALFITDPYDELGSSLLHHLSINRILAKTLIFLTLQIENKPYILEKNKFKITQKAEGFYFLNISCGFAENIHLPKMLERLAMQNSLPFELELEKIVYFVEIISLKIKDRKINYLWFWQKYLFSFMLRNALPDIQFYHIPYNKTIAIGTYYQL